MITQVMLWGVLGAIGCAAFAALGIWASVTDEGHRAQRRARTKQPVPVLPQPAAESGGMVWRGEGAGVA